MNCPLDDFDLEVRQFIDKDDIGIRQSTSTLLGRISCIGSLKIVHSNENDLGNFQDLQLATDGGVNKDGEYQNLKRGFPVLKRNIIIQIITIGNCCWEIYEKRKFKGKKQYLHHGEHFPDIQPRSVRRVECRY